MSGPTIHNVEQRSPEWYALRCGMLTASAIGQMVKSTPPGPEFYTCPECDAQPKFPCTSLAKGKAFGGELKEPHRGRKKAAEDGAATTPIRQVTVTPIGDAQPWLATLAAERVTGHIEQTPTTRDMWRGIESEPFARDAYSQHMGKPVVEVGFVAREIEPGVTIGYSPDGLVGDDGLIEIKAPRAKSHLLTAVDHKIPDAYMAQLQTGLLVTQRSWIDFISFAGGMALWRQRVEPSEQWHTAIKNAARAAETAIADLTERYREAVVGLPVMDRLPDFDMELSL